jgi:hypothetical protein
MKNKKNNYNKLSDWENQPQKQKIRRKKKKKSYKRDLDDRK